MSDPNGAAAVLEAALQVAVDGLKRAKERNDMASMMAYHDVLTNAYNVAEGLDYTMPNPELAKLDPDLLIGMGPRDR